MGVILHRRHASLLPLGLALAALAAAPAAAQAPAEPEVVAEQPAAVEPLGTVEELGSGALGGVGDALQDPPAPVGEAVEAQPPVVGATLDGLGQALQPGELAQPAPGIVPVPSSPPEAAPAPEEPGSDGGDQPEAGGGVPEDKAGEVRNRGVELAPERETAGRYADAGDPRDLSAAGGAEPVPGRGESPTVAAVAARVAAGGGSAGGAGAVVNLPPARTSSEGALERIVSVVPWPAYAALGLMGTLLALSAARSHRYRLRLAEAERQAMTDGLTGLPNRTDAELFLERIVAGSERSGRRLAIALIDLDHFKAINDDFGHPAGDATLRGVAHALRSELRAADHVGRLGGEEFLAILPDADLEEALAVAERVRERIAAMPRRVDRRVTASIGVACLPGDAESAGDLTAAADRALYAAKEAGRDRVVWAGALKSPDRNEPAAVSA